MTPTEPGSSLHGVTTGEQVVVLTFDDGPRSGDTDHVLSELALVGARATFFTLLVRARLEGSLLAAAVAAGHEIALHGVDHERLVRTDPTTLATRLHDARAELEDLTGTRIQFFRPPYGSQTIDQWHATIEAGLVPVVWQRECREWDIASGSQAFVELENLQAGMIVLAHDSIAGPDDGAEPFNVPFVDRAAVTAQVIARICEQDLMPTSLSCGLAAGEPAWRVWLDMPRSDDLPPQSDEVR